MTPALPEITLPAITLWQPWASLIAIGVKPYETRPQPAPQIMCGRRIAIHAAVRKPRLDEITPAIKAAMLAATGDEWWFSRLALGAVVCTAFLHGSKPAQSVTPDDFGDYRVGRWAWVLSDVEKFASPCPAKGQQRYGWPWIVPPCFVA